MTARRFAQDTSVPVGQTQGDGRMPAQLLLEGPRG